MRGDSVDCGAVADALPRIVDGTRRTDRALLRHAATCLRCQAELARYRRMLRLLHQLRWQMPWMPSSVPTAAVLEVTGEVGSSADHPARQAGTCFRVATEPAGRRRVATEPAGRRRVATALAAATAVAGVGAAAVLAAANRGRPAVRHRGALQATVALLTWGDGPSGFGPRGKATAAGLRIAEGQ